MADADATEEESKRQGSPATVLVVEDETIVALALSRYLRACGYTVVHACSGEAAQEVFSWASIDAVISDVNLGPGISGLELANWLQDRFPTVRIVLASGVWDLERDAAAVSDSPMLRKPYLYSEVVASLR